MKTWEYLNVVSTMTARLLDSPEGHAMNRHDPDNWVWDGSIQFVLEDGRDVKYNRPKEVGPYVPEEGNPQGFTEVVLSVSNMLGSMGWELVSVVPGRMRLLVGADTGGGSTSTVSHPLDSIAHYKRATE